jgi:hypothetical protein
MRPGILFFARDYQAEFFIHLSSERYESLLATLTLKEKKLIEEKGFKVVGCLEEEFDSLPEANVENNYLETSFSSDRYLCGAPLKDRRRILRKEISFWSRILDKYNPTLVVNETVAIEVSEVLYLESKKRNIRYISWMSFPMNYFYWQSSPMHNSLDSSVFSTTPDYESIEEARKYISQVRNGEGRPFYASNLKSRYSLYILAKNLYWYARCVLMENTYRDNAKNLLLLGNNAPFYLSRLKSVAVSIAGKYDNLHDYEDFEIVFYPLHYEPEAVLYYMAEFYDNQLAVIENVAKCLAHNQILVIKEHPQQTGFLLQQKYRQLRKRVSNLVYLPGEYSTYHLILKSKMVVTLGSTAGMEALILGKCVIVLGRIFYDKCPGVTTTKDFNELRDIIRQNRLPSTDESSLLKFLGQMIMYSHQGNPFAHQNLFTNVNINNIVSAIEGELDKVLKVTT